MLEGKAVYDAEIEDLMKKLSARGIVLVVIEGKKNQNDIEYGSALTLEDIPKVVYMLRAIADEFEKDLAGIIKRADKREI